MLDRYDIMLAFGAALIAVSVEISLIYLAVFFLLIIGTRIRCCWSLSEVLMGFVATLIAVRADIPLMSLAVIFVLVIGARAGCCCCCCPRQPIRPPINDTSEKFLDASPEEHGDVPAEVPTTQMVFALSDPVAPVRRLTLTPIQTLTLTLTPIPNP